MASPTANKITGRATLAPPVGSKQSAGPASHTAFEMFDDSQDNDTPTLAILANQTTGTAILVPAVKLRQSARPGSHTDFVVFDDSQEDDTAAPPTTAPSNIHQTTGISTHMPPAEEYPGEACASPPSFSLLKDLTTDFTGGIQVAIWASSNPQGSAVPLPRPPTGAEPAPPLAQEGQGGPVQAEEPPTTGAVTARLL